MLRRVYETYQAKPDKVGTQKWQRRITAEILAGFVFQHVARADTLAAGGRRNKRAPYRVLRCVQTIILPTVVEMGPILFKEQRRAFRFRPTGAQRPEPVAGRPPSIFFAGPVNERRGEGLGFLERRFSFQV